jgi:undecaprenyl diphosphate synthase
MKHLAIILDGNRTWAREQGKPEFLGHTQGAKNIQTIVKAVIKHNIEVLSMYVLSTENLKNRSDSELKHLFSLFEKLIDYKNLFQENNIKLQISGDISALPDSVQKSMNNLLEQTSQHTGLILNLCMNYGGRDEIIRAIHKIEDIESVTEESFTQLLDSGNLPDIDLVIRTSGHQRISNFLLWKLAYAEMYFPKVHWPAFSEQDLQAAIDYFKSTKRKFGK